MSSKTKEMNEENIKKNATSKVASKKTTELETIAKKKSKTKTIEENINKKTTSTEKSVVKKSHIEKKSGNVYLDKVKVSKPSKSVSTSRKKTASNERLNKRALAEVVEYYDLPYRYNETVVKILYQTPETLFVYWDIADSDRQNYIKEYGENFFNITRPVLIVHNDTMKYSFEVSINDFANSWYLHINDSKCDYRVELGRRPNYYNEEATKEIREKIHTDYIYVSTSNGIESPNNRVLFNTNENNTIKVRNVKTNNEKAISLFEIIKNLPVIKGEQNIPYISEKLLKRMYSGIYQNEEVSMFDKVTNNPSSSGNPSSGSMSSRMF